MAMREHEVCLQPRLPSCQTAWDGLMHSGVGPEFATFGIEAFLGPQAIL
jgi:hypothetical protein